jgi:hypothetical protein
MAIQPEDRYVWLAILFPARAAEGVVGAARTSLRLHWMRQEACNEAERWVEEMQVGPIDWGTIDDNILVGRTRTHIVVVRGILLPRGAPPA